MNADDKFADIEAAMNEMAKTIAERPSFFNPGPHNHFDDFCTDEKLPALFPDAWKRYMTGMHMVLVPSADVRRIVDDRERDWSPAVHAMLAEHLEVPSVIRFGGRTAHDCGVVEAKDPDGIIQLLVNSERALVEAWAWCPRRGYLPITIHDKFLHTHEFRVQVRDERVSAVSNSMWGDDCGHEELARVWNSVAYRVGHLAATMTGRHWLDIGVCADRGGFRLYDVNPDDGSSWPGWHPERDDDIPRSAVWSLGDKLVRCDLNAEGMVLHGTRREING